MVAASLASSDGTAVLEEPGTFLDLELRPRPFFLGAM